ncbi:5-methylcytosine-specific restriction protein B [Prauserella shujinwangii]|uniref:5-methylcytosine-specific restriction protein B n=1 Tax=Prauserella shujinwangii TaxID=1453103 RepID=A0A2T0LWZ4_9PSEU|nr:AAA family ATPase [Prauserella shujinwangii]PRX48540.1 5-methylcytosine-specific restriction protein B [Prauserella shujinwangii]
MADTVRIARLLRACMEVLRDAGKPTHGREVLRQVAERVSPTPYEQEYVGTGAQQQPRWENHLRWYTGDAATVGWLTKRDGLWELTEAGETALDVYGDEQLAAELKRRYGDIRRQRAEAARKLEGTERVIARMLSVVEPGFWTSYEDLAELAGVSPETIGHYLAGASSRIAGEHRLAFADGRLPSEEFLNFRQRGTDPAARLRSEGVEFDDTGRPSQTQRMTAVEIEARLSEMDDDEPDESPTTRAWLVRGSAVDGRDLVPVWQERGSVSLAASSLRPVTPPVSRSELKSVVEEDYQHKSYAARNAKLDEFDAFCNRMRIGDFVLTTSQGKAYVGHITGEAIYAASSDNRSNLRRKVRWLNTTQPVPFSNLPRPLPAKLHSQADVVELTEDMAAIERLIHGLGVTLAPSQTESPGPRSFPAVTSDMAEELLLDRHWLQRQVDLLRERKQLIFYGPPGTGKTYLACAFADKLADPSAIKLVQFHPSYTYEDFFEGFRPVPGGSGKLEFDLRPGPLRDLVDAARANPTEPYFLIIDEINRANLPKVFGELYFSLEYRDRPISLMYSTDSNFTLPENLFVIGTMNTADRSITQLDAAIRRRFAFVELHPDQPPVADLLARWLERLDKEGGLEHHRDAPAVLSALNDRIRDRDLAIGPSYLMRKEIYLHEDGLERVWEHSILPLLAEYHHGASRSRLDEYRLSELRPSAGSLDE